MTHRRIARAAGIAVAITAGIAALATPAAAPAHAQDKPPAAARDVAREFAAAKRLLDAKSWKEAKAALEKLLAAVPGDPGVLALLPEIEDSLRTATFRAQWKGVDVKALIGAGCVKYSPGSRVVEFDTNMEARSEGAWSSPAGGITVFDRPLEGDISVEFTWTAERENYVYPPPALLLCYDTDKQSGYMLSVELTKAKYTESFEGRAAFLRLDGPEKRTAVGSSKAVSYGPFPTIRYERKSGNLTVSINGAEAGRSTDTRYGSGALAMAFGEMGAPRRIRVTGRLPDSWLRRTIADAENEAVRLWESGWTRETALPAWVKEHEERAAKEIGRLPSDATDAQRAFFAKMVAQAWEGDSKPLVVAMAAASARKDATEAYLDALVQLANDDPESAEDLFRACLGRDGSFAPARAGVGIALLRAGRPDDARAHLDEARALMPSFPPLLEADAWDAIGAGDLKKAADILAKGAAAGASSRGLTMARKILQRIEKGPQWVKRFDFETEHFRISSDHSITACGDVGKQLEDAFASYARHFRGAPKSGKAQVYVFSGMDGYLDYAGDLGTSIEGTLGVYLPRLRQLAVFLHDDRATLWDTVRHEGFHQYLHRITDGVPIWFNEGAAEYFGFTRRKAGKTVLGAAGGTQRELLALMRKGFTPLRALFVMEQPAFMRKPEVHYVQAWSVIHFLRETKDPRFAGLLDRYLDAILARKSAEEAYDAVLEPVIEPLIDAWTSHVDGVVSGR
ncbi:MAG: hypothetical protein HMLKMBBP_02706 [Planctomycetes bacterium]|nr:hypothetical protein [Planctomycetota bacterium]